MNFNLKSLIISVLDDYGKPMELKRLTRELNRRKVMCRSITVKKKLMTSKEFFLVDQYNGETAKIWALGEWPREKRSMISYTDWEQYTPRIGKVIEGIANILENAGRPVYIEEIRDKLDGVRHHKSVLMQVVEHDPLFVVSDGWVKFNQEEELSDSSSHLVFAQYNSPSEYIFIAQKIVTQVSIELVSRRFLKRFPFHFSMENINFWAELFGLTAEELLSALYHEVNLSCIGDRIYLVTKVSKWIDLERIMSLYGLGISELSSVFEEAFIKAEGNLNQVPEYVPFTLPVIKSWLKKQNKLIMVTPEYWFPISVIPEQIHILSRFRSKLTQNFQGLIIQSFISKGTLLTTKEIIFNSIGIVNPTQRIKCLYTFVLELLNDEYVYQVPDTEYWALKKWATLLNLNMIQAIMGLLDEEDEAVSLESIAETLKQYDLHFTEVDLRELLLLWPEIEQTENGLFRTRASLVEINPEILKPYILDALKEEMDGISLGDLYEYLVNRLVSHDSTISKRELKHFLQTWGNVAIIRPKVYLMEKAPLSQMRLADIAYQIVNEIGQPVGYRQLESELRERSNYTGVVSSVLLNEPKLMRPTRGYYALREWGLPEYDPDIHNKIGDILVDIIKKAERPLHKSEIRRQLRRMGIQMNNVTLQMDIVEEERIEQVARGVYALRKWNLQFRDLLKHNFPFRLQTPDGEQNIYELEDGIVFEYMVTRFCLENGRLLIRRNISPYFPLIEQQLRFTIMDIDGDPYMAWADKMSDNRWQILGVKRWYKTYKPRYGESIYIKQMYDDPCQLHLFTAEQAEKLLGL